MAKVNVIMSNDFPHKVVADEETAKKLVEELNKKDIERSERERQSRIYYRSYQFEVE